MQMISVHIWLTTWPNLILGKVFLRLISCSIVLHLRGSIQEHLSPHQFGVLTFGGYETIHFGIRTLFDLHINWVVMQIDIENAFNNIFQAVIFKDVWDVGGPLVSIIPFIELFYGAHFFLYYQHG